MARSRDFGLAATYFQPAPPKAGDVDALYALGTLYQSGRGVALKTTVARPPTS